MGGISPISRRTRQMTSLPLSNPVRPVRQRSDSCRRREGSGSGYFHTPLGGVYPSDYGLLSETSFDCPLIKAGCFAIK